MERAEIDSQYELKPTINLPMKQLIDPSLFVYECFFKFIVSIIRETPKLTCK